MDLEKRQFTVSSTDRFEITKVTPEVEAAVDTTGVNDGLVFVSTPHTTGALSTNEYEARLMNDFIDKFEELVPPEDNYTHDRHHIATETQANAHAHMICAMIRNPVFVTLTDGELDLGTWEEILYFEVDGPNDRTVNVVTLS